MSKRTISAEDMQAMIEYAADVAAFVESIPKTLRGEDGRFVFDASRHGRAIAHARMLHKQLLRAVVSEVEVEP